MLICSNLGRDKNEIEKDSPEGLSQRQIVSLLVFWGLSLRFATVIGLCDHWDHAGYF